MGWYEITDDLHHFKTGEIKKVAENIASGEMKMTIHDGYDKAAFEGKRGSGKKTELAGFPKNHKAWEDAEFKAFKDKPVKDTFLDFLDLACKKSLAKRDAASSECFDVWNTRNKGKTSQPMKPPGSKDVVPATSGKVTRLAEELGEKEFLKLVEKKGLVATVEKGWKTSLVEVETKALSGTKIASKLRKTLKTGAHVLSAAGIGLWVADVINVFTTESTDWDKAAAATALIPFVGCGTEFANRLTKTATKEVSALDGIDVSLCLLGDALLLSGVTAPLGFFVHLTRYLLQFFEQPPSLPSIQQLKDQRDKLWNAFIHGQLYNSLTDTSWRRKLEGAMAFVALDLLHQGAETIGMLEAGDQAVLEGVEDGKKYKRETGQVQNATEPAIAQVREKMAALIMSRQREYLLSLPKSIMKSLKQSFGPAGDGYNEQFIKKINAKEKIESYPRYSKFVGIFKTYMEKHAHAGDHMAEASRFLEKNPLELPSILFIAENIGIAAGNNTPPELGPRSARPANVTKRSAKFTQAKKLQDPPSLKGLELDPPGLQNSTSGNANSTISGPHKWKRAVEAKVLDPMLFYKEKTRRDNWSEVRKHTLAIRDFLEGKIKKESDLPKTAAGLPDIEFKKFHLLIAMHIGYKLAEWNETQGASTQDMDKSPQNDNDQLIQYLYGKRPTEWAKNLPEFWNTKCKDHKGMRRRANSARVCTS